MIKRICDVMGCNAKSTYENIQVKLKNGKYVDNYKLDMCAGHFDELCSLLNVNRSTEDDKIGIS